MNYIFKSGLFGYFSIFLISFLFFSSLQLANKTFLCPDSFYHAKIASFLSNGKLIRNFPWLPYTILAENYSDHHFLYHILLIPFVKLFGDQTGIKVATLFFATFSIFIFYWLLRKFKIKAAFVWTFLLLTSSVFLTRLNLAKVPPAALSVLFLGLYALFKRKYLLLGIISFVYVWLYNTWPILFVATILYCFANAFKKIIDKWQIIFQNLKSFKFRILILGFKIFFKNFFAKENLGLIISCLFGIVCGLVINPYFPSNLYFNWVHIVKIGLKNYQNILSVGAEWYPFEPTNLILNNLFIFAVWFIAIGWFFVSFKKSSLLFSGQKAKTLSLFIFSSLFLIFTIKSRRNVEYFVPLAILFSSFSLNRLFSNFPWKEYFSQFKVKEFPYNLMSFILGFFLLVIFVFCSFSFFEKVWAEKIKEFASGASFDQFKKVSEFLKENTQKGEIIFHSSWDEFPPLFYHNDKNYYIAGLDPTFMYEKNKALYWIWFNIVSGKQKNNLSKTIKENFNARYVFVQANRQKMKENLDQDKDFEKVYEDKEGYVYKIKNF